jgi:DNA-binding transcriptional MerR regulator
MAQPEELLFPALAAEALGVSPATLRRYAQAWEKAFGPLPRAPGGGRLWPRAALARLQAARELAQREGIPLEEALLRVEGEAPLVATARPEREALGLLREALARLERLEGEVRALREALTQRRRWWWR